MLSVQIAIEEIEQVEFKGMSLLTLPLGDTLTIRHRHQYAPNPIIFGAYRGLKHSISVFGQMGVPVKEGALPRQHGSDS